MRFSMSYDVTGIFFIITFDRLEIKQREWFQKFVLSRHINCDFTSPSWATTWLWTEFKIWPRPFNATVYMIPRVSTTNVMSNHLPTSFCSKLFAKNKHLCQKRYILSFGLSGATIIETNSNQPSTSFDTCRQGPGQLRTSAGSWWRLHPPPPLSQ